MARHNLDALYWALKIGEAKKFTVECLATTGGSAEMYLAALRPEPRREAWHGFPICAASGGPRRCLPNLPSSLASVPAVSLTIARPKR